MFFFLNFDCVQEDLIDRWIRKLGNEFIISVLFNYLACKTCEENVLYIKYV
jgi:hypothetical protein